MVCVKMPGKALSLTAASEADLRREISCMDEGISWERQKWREKNEVY
jgi:hypothetical protein